ncbi:MAG: EAL domain-containing protein [Burkholderiaceae bacterium]
MNAPQAAIDDYSQGMRVRRLIQIARLVLVAESVTAALYASHGQWGIALTLATAAAMAVLCLMLSRHQLNSLGGAVLLASLTVLSSTLMWISEGLHDVALVTYPVILIMAGLLGAKRYFAVLLAGMLGFVSWLSLATYVWHTRADGVLAGGLAMWRDTTVILLVSAAAVWIVIDDMQTALARLREQIGKFNESQAHLAYLAKHDVLTGLPNRALGRDRIEQALGQAARRKNLLAVLFVDLDNFKSVNDMLGHATGDDFLKEVALRLTQAVRKSDVVSRHGGDEFLIGLVDIASADDASNVASAILANLAKPFFVKDSELSCTGSIGIALHPQDGVDYDALLRQADIAMYSAKESGRNAWRFFDPAMQANLQQGMLLVSSLRGALARREFELHYQPIIDLVSGRVLGAEALIRWRRPESGLVLPGLFIDAAERSGLIVEVGEWVLEEACRQLVEWQAIGCGEFTMAVNLSVVQFRRGNVDAVVQRVLQRTGLHAGCLELELTESTLVDDADSFILALQRLKALGVRLSIDDFGTGYSNLSYLQRFAVDKLKVDRSFIVRLNNSGQDRAIVDAIVQIARSLNLVVTAEGIEDPSVVQALIEMGCAQGQGYLFGKPQPAAEFERLLPRAPELAVLSVQEAGAAFLPTGAGSST